MRLQILYYWTKIVSKIKGKEYMMKSFEKQGVKFPGGLFGLIQIL